ncbi:hypothetical protein [Agrococcus baldri]|uniref:Uncharacterized protein n=1 Tax=Agrococcus baldri TaxID=153730 RepID=A0AA87UQV1_9MICO|nr:hypothetical protein [Agrococcus baldri]GEK79411.1 hypothetical protein ABA31_07620 [Agrococcus baldri]
MQTEESGYRVRFPARFAVYFWLALLLWAVVLLGSWWWLGPAGAGAAAAVLLLVVWGVLRSGVDIRADRSVRAVDGFRTRRMSGNEVARFIAVDNVSLLAGGVLGLNGGGFMPDRLGMELHDGRTITLQWCFANPDSVREICRQLNRVLQGQTVERMTRGRHARGNGLTTDS